MPSIPTRCCISARSVAGFHGDMKLENSAKATGSRKNKKDRKKLFLSSSHRCFWLCIFLGFLLSPPSATPSRAAVKATKLQTLRNDENKNKDNNTTAAAERDNIIELFSSSTLIPPVASPPCWPSTSSHLNYCSMVSWAGYSLAQRRAVHNSSPPERWCPMALSRSRSHSRKADSVQIGDGIMESGRECTYWMHWKNEQKRAMLACR